MYDVCGGSGPDWDAEASEKQGEDTLLESAIAVEGDDVGDVSSIVDTGRPVEIEGVAAIAGALEGDNGEVLLSADFSVFLDRRPANEKR